MTAVLRSLANRTAIVTGSSSGNGRGIAIALAQAGANVICSDLQPDMPISKSQRNAAAEPPTHELIQEYDIKTKFIPGDVTKQNTWDALVDSAQQLGSIDILVNNAGMLGASARLHETSLAHWQKTLDLNLTSIFLACRTILPHMLKQQARQGGCRATIVNIASNGASYAVPEQPAYCATKAAVLNLTRSLAIDYGRDGIKSVSLSPFVPPPFDIKTLKFYSGIISTPMTDQFLEIPENLALYKSKTPWPRFGKPADVGAAVLYLASDASDYANGTDLILDGGFLAS